MDAMPPLWHACKRAPHIWHKDHLGRLVALLHAVRTPKEVWHQLHSIAKLVAPGLAPGFC